MSRGRDALRDAAPQPFWTDRDDAPDPTEPLSGRATTDLAVVGGGLTGLWTALLAKERYPELDVVVLEAGSVAATACGRSGGFISESLTQDLEHGIARWPGDLEELLLMGRENVAAIAAFVWSHDVDADLRLVGRTVCAVRPHQVPRLETSARLHEQYGESAVFLSREEVQADVVSPTFLAGMRVRSGGGLLDPAALCWGMLRVAKDLGVRVHENTTVTGLEAERDRIRLVTTGGVTIAGKTVVATDVSVEPFGRLGERALPVHEHALVTEPLSRRQLDSLGWRENQALTHAGDRSPYCRRTPGNRILWGGEAAHVPLADTFFGTFPQLEGVRFSHRWTDVGGSAGRCTPVFGTAVGGKASYATGFAGWGVAGARFAANTMLDLLEDGDTPRTRLGMVRRGPPFPPESRRAGAGFSG